MNRMFNRLFVYRVSTKPGESDHVIKQAETRKQAEDQLEGDPSILGWRFERELCPRCKRSVEHCWCGRLMKMDRQFHVRNAKKIEANWNTSASWSNDEGTGRISFRPGTPAERSDRRFDVELTEAGCRELAVELVKRADWIAEHRKEQG